MFVVASAAFAEDVALIVTVFVAIGLIVNVLVVYIIAQVLAERKENQERRARSSYS